MSPFMYPVGVMLLEILGPFGPVSFLHALELIALLHHASVQMNVFGLSAVNRSMLKCL